MSNMIQQTVAELCKVWMATGAPGPTQLENIRAVIPSDGEREAM